MRWRMNWKKTIERSYGTISIDNTASNFSFARKMIRKAAVDSGALIPDRQIVLAPSPSRMKSGFFDMSPEECQKCIALGLREFDDLAHETAAKKDRFAAIIWVSSDERMDYGGVLLSQLFC